MFRTKHGKRCFRVAFLPLAGLLLTGGPLAGQSDAPSADKGRFPVKPTPLVHGVFNRSEGITFNGEGNLYVTANSALWRVDTKGEATRIADLYSNLGLAAIGECDVLVADFGPTNAFDHGKNDDGIIWRLDSKTGELIVIAEKMPGVASLAFGKGKFDHHAIYATSTRQGGGTVYKVDVGIKGAPLHR